MITPIVLLAGCRFSLCVLWPRADQAAIHSQNVFIFRHKLEASWSFTRNFLLRIVFFLSEPSGRWKNYILTRIGERLQRSLGLTTRNYRNTSSRFFISVFFLSVLPHTRADWMGSSMKSLVTVIVSLPVCSIHIALITSYHQLCTFPDFANSLNEATMKLFMDAILSDFSQSVK